jgi:hypothetical protein
MDTIFRLLSAQITHYLGKGKSILLLGPRQTGKTTMIRQLPSDWLLSLIQPRVRQRYERDPSLLADEVAALADGFNKKHGKLPLVIIDEVQKVPAIMDVVQGLIDDGVAQFILTGSSARKLKRDKHMNLLPGRVIPLFLDPIMLKEYAQASLQDLLIFGSLPEILLTENAQDKEQLLSAYVSLYLEEEIRAEATVRNLAPFSRFLELSASESGYIVNRQQLSQQIGVASSTIASYYQILEDGLMVERIDPITESKTRYRLSKSAKYLFFDLGVRRLAAGEGVAPNAKQLGHLFEQFVGLECLRLCHLYSGRAKLRYWRDLNGPEVDWVITFAEQDIPIEVKWTDAPKAKDAQHLTTYLNEYAQAKKGYVVCRTPNRMKLTDQVDAISWQDLPTLFDVKSV